MSKERALSLVAGIVIFLSMGYPKVAWLYWVPRNWSLWWAGLYWFAIAAGMLVLVLRQPSLSSRQKLGWGVFLFFVPPLGSLALLWRLYWYKPAPIAKSAEEQREILHEMWTGAKEERSSHDT